MSSVAFFSFSSTDINCLSRVFLHPKQSAASSSRGHSCSQRHPCPFYRHLCSAIESDHCLFSYLHVPRGGCIFRIRPFEHPRRANIVVRPARGRTSVLNNLSFQNMSGMRWILKNVQSLVPRDICHPHLDTIQKSAYDAGNLDCHHCLLSELGVLLISRVEASEYGN